MPPGVVGQFHFRSAPVPGRSDVRGVKLWKYWKPSEVRILLRPGRARSGQNDSLPARTMCPCHGFKMHPLNFSSVFCLHAGTDRKHAVTIMSTTSDVRPPVTRRQWWLTKIAVFLAVSVAIGWFYGWACGRFFPEKTRVGFMHGVIHGA